MPLVDSSSSKVGIEHFAIFRGTFAAVIARSSCLADTLWATLTQPKHDRCLIACSKETLQVMLLGLESRVAFTPVRRGLVLLHEPSVDKSCIESFWGCTSLVSLSQQIWICIIMRLPLAVELLNEPYFEKYFGLSGPCIPMWTCKPDCLVNSLFVFPTRAVEPAMIFPDSFRHKHRINIDWP